MSSDEDSFNSNIYAYFAIQLNDRKSSPLYNLVRAEDSSEKFRIGLSNLSDCIKAMMIGKWMQKLFITNDDQYKNKEEIYKIFESIFNAIKRQWTYDWDNYTKSMLFTKPGTEVLALMVNAEIHKTIDEYGTKNINRIQDINTYITRFNMKKESTINWSKDGGSFNNIQGRGAGKKAFKGIITS